MLVDAAAGPPLSLFDGDDIAGWEQIGDGSFVFGDGVIESRGGMGLLWYRPRTFADFVLEVVWRVERPSDNSGVFVRFPDPQGDVWAPVDTGYEVQILDEADEPERCTGAIYTFAAPTAVPTRPAGEWNRMVVRAEGQHYRVAVNDAVVTDFRGDRALAGHVGLQNHDVDSRVQFASVVARDLAGREPGGGPPSSEDP